MIGSLQDVLFVLNQTLDNGRISSANRRSRNHVATNIYEDPEVLFLDSLPVRAQQAPALQSSAMTIEPSSRQRFAGLPDEAESHRQASIRNTQPEVQARPHAGSTAHGLQVWLRSGIGVEHFFTTIISVKMCFDMDTVKRSKVAKEFLFPCSKFDIQCFNSYYCS